MSTDLHADPIVIAAAVRTPLGRFQGELSGLAGHQLGSQRGDLARFHLGGDELAEGALVAGDAGDLPVAQYRDCAGQRVPAAGEVALGDVVQQHKADRVGHRSQGRGVTGGAQALVDLLQQLVVVGEDVWPPSVTVCTTVDELLPSEV